MQAVLMRNLIFSIRERFEFFLVLVLLIGWEFVADSFGVDELLGA